MEHKALLTEEEFLNAHQEPYGGPPPLTPDQRRGSRGQGLLFLGLSIFLGISGSAANHVYENTIKISRVPEAIVYWLLCYPATLGLFWGTIFSLIFWRTKRYCTLTWLLVPLGILYIVEAFLPWLWFSLGVEPYG